MKLFLAPHNDDETLFGAYTIMIEKPLVIIVTDSMFQAERGLRITWKQRREETLNAMKILGAKVEFLGINDTNFSKEKLEKALRKYNPDLVFAPSIEGGDRWHDLVGIIAVRLFENVIFYSTYSKNRWFPKGSRKIEFNQEMKRLKLKALECYPSQSNLASTRQFFKNMKTKDEYYV